MTDAGSELQTDGAAHRKERFANLLQTNSWMSSDVAVECSVHAFTRRLMRWLRYRCIYMFRVFYVMSLFTQTGNLNIIDSRWHFEVLKLQICVHCSHVCSAVTVFGFTVGFGIKKNKNRGLRSISVFMVPDVNNAHSKLWENVRISERYRIATDTGCIISNRIGFCCIGENPHYVHHCRFCSW